MKILVLNSGSSSLKCQYFIDNKSVASVLIEGIGSTKSHTKLEALNIEKKSDTPVANHHEALEILFDLFKEYNILVNIKDLDAVGHRVVHGGNTFSKPVRIDDEVIQSIKSLIPLAPLHNPANLEGIEILYRQYPTLAQVAVFDTAFHQSMPEYSYLYPLPYALSQTAHIRRYGFHGSSHHYVAKEAALLLQQELTQSNLITIHLGNGASITAIQKGKSIDTSMGFTPLEGLMMGTRSGDIDPAIIPYLEKTQNYSIDEIDNILNKESGLKGICGSNDMREVLQGVSNHDPKSKLALDMYVYRIKKYIGAYTVALGKIDAIVFTAGIGEHASRVRELVCDGLYESIGLEIDKKKNEEGEREIQSQRSKIKLFIIATDEELEIAMQTEALIGEVSS